MQDAKTFARWHLQKRLRDVARLQPRALNAKGIVSQAINPKIIALTKHRAGVLSSPLNSSIDFWFL